MGIKASNYKLQNDFFFILINLSPLWNGECYKKNYDDF